MKTIRLKRNKLYFLLAFFCLFFCRHGMSEGNSSNGNSESNNTEESCEETFTYVYDNHLWGTNKDGTPSSGYGSSLENAVPYIHFLMNFISENKIKSVVDIGCGDWSFSRYIDWNKVRYIGVDVVKSVVTRNIENYAQPNISFVHGDFLQMEELPSADLLICKDVLSHLTNKDVLLFLTKIGKYKHCLITNDIISHGQRIGEQNQDTIKRGNGRPLDLKKPPFSLNGVSALQYRVYDDIKQIFYVKGSNLKPSQETSNASYARCKLHNKKDCYLCSLQNDRDMIDTDLERLSK